ncbi:unnamed protein product [Ranitomeya imitator]|uniref:Chromo domain-containing protein n=1 Tax=Ranitomeya imitator TaxID=111125 RepID=A0ABN9LIK9_9NEOB|nr:unnamed protein product [Ranitomeya imitator]
MNGLSTSGRCRMGALAKWDLIEEKALETSSDHNLGFAPFLVEDSANISLVGVNIWRKDENIIQIDFDRGGKHIPEDVIDKVLENGWGITESKGHHQICYLDPVIANLAIQEKKCDQCDLGYKGYPDCVQCNCGVSGSINEDPCVDPCVCKENVVGDNCHTCKHGFFNLKRDNPSGCEECFCSGVSNICIDSRLTYTKVIVMNGWYLTEIDGNINVAPNKDKFDGPQQLSIKREDARSQGLVDIIYWSAPAAYLHRKALGLLYDEPNSVDQAEKILLALCQGQEAAELYCQKFRKWSVLTKWNEDALAAIFRKGLSESIKDVMVGFPTPTEMDPVMVQAIHDWIQPTSVKSLQKLLGFANFYRRFIANFSSVVKPLTDLTKKGADVEVDASEIGAGAILSQRNSDGSLMKLCAFFSRKFSPAEHNYDVGNQELLAMKWAFEEWRHWLEGAMYRIVVLTDHKNLIYLESAKRLNPRQSHFDFVVSYIPGTKNVKADALSRSFFPDSPGVLEPVGILKEGVILSAISPDLRRVLQEFQADEPDRCPVGKLFVPDRWTTKVEPSDFPGVDSVVDRLQQIWAYVVDNLVLSQEEAQCFANRRRISEIINLVSFRLALPASFAIHNVFHKSLLRKFVEPVVPSVDPPAPALVNGELEYVVEKILDSRFSRRKLQYLVKWKGYGQEDNSWVSASDVHAVDLVRAFHRAHSDRPGGSASMASYAKI